MNLLALILWIIAAVLFIFDGTTYAGARAGYRIGNGLGLFFLTVGLIVEFASKNHSIRF